MVVTPSGPSGVCVVPPVGLEPRHVAETVLLLLAEKVEMIAKVIFQKLEPAVRFTVPMVSALSNSKKGIICPLYQGFMRNYSLPLCFLRIRLV